MSSQLFKMSSCAANSTPQAGAHSVSARRDFEMGYDTWLVLIFYLGVVVIYYVFQIVIKINALLKAEVPAGEKPRTEAKPPSVLAGAALGIVKASAAPDSEGLGKFNAHIKENKYNASLDPLEVLNRINKAGAMADTGIYNSLLDACICSKNFERAYQLFTEMKESAVHAPPDVVTYNIYMKGIAEAVNSGEKVDLSMIDELLADMRVRDVRPTVVTFNTVLDVCVLTEHLDLAWKYFDEMQGAHNLSPDAYTFSILLKGVKASDRRPHFFEYLFSMLYDFVKTRTVAQLDEVLANAAVDACGRFKELQKLDSLLALLHEKRWTFSLLSYGKLAAIFGQFRLANRVGEVYREIRASGVELNDVTFGCILEAYLKCDRADLVASLYRELSGEDSRLFNVVVCTTLIRAFGRLRRFVLVREVYRRIPAGKLNLIACNAMLDACVRCEEYEEMGRVFAELADGKTGELVPDIVTYSTLIKGLCRGGNVSRALVIYSELKHKGMDLDEMLFNSILDGLTNHPNGTAYVEPILSDMRACKIPCSNYTYSILIKLYAKSKDAARALGVYDDMRRSGVLPSVVVYTSLLQVCIRHRMIDRAVELFREMRRNGVAPDRVAYNTIVNGCTYAGRIQTGCEIACEATTEGVRLADEIYSNLLKGLLTNRKMEDGQKHEFATQICNYVSVNRIQVNQDCYAKVMDTLVLHQQSEPAPKPSQYPEPVTKVVEHADHATPQQTQPPVYYGYYYAYPAPQYMAETAYCDYGVPDYGCGGTDLDGRRKLAS